ncbi:hypothetical protein EB796_017583 [Bugula neritina]|uniref:Uncharacterized protein n=1 Tax=Bugula neritina TaxID=10212 RepID=A0A7J7JE09_BUGNE|nr:hypothetical protein EB796_017583 [Bugula neritina]
MMYNYKGHAVIGCNCTVELEACLRNESATGSALAEEVLDTQFGTFEYVKCLVVSREKKQCVEWDPVFHK